MEKLLKETGSIDMRPLERATSKFHTKEPEINVAEHSDATPDES